MCGGMKPQFLSVRVTGAVCLLLAATVVLATTKKPSLRPININTATSKRTSVGSRYRRCHSRKDPHDAQVLGPFKSVHDLLAIKGLGRKRLDKMRKYLSAGKTAQANKPGTSIAKDPAAAKGTAKARAPAQTEESTEPSETQQEPPQ
jgi:hypothetical protein